MNLAPGLGLGLALGCLLSAACRQPTEIRLLLTADADLCGKAPDTAIRAGPLADIIAPDAPPQTTTVSCDGGTIGTLTVAPAGASDAPVAFRITMGFSSSDGSSCAPKSDPHCIEARRLLNYLPHEALTLPIILRESCAGVDCADPSTTCAKGRCVQAAVDPAECLGAEGCGEGSLKAPPVVRFVYVVPQVADSTVSIYAADAATGRLRHDGYLSFADGIAPQGIAVTPPSVVPPLAYLTDFRQGVVYPLAIQPAGQLQPVVAAPDPAGTQLGKRWIDLDPSGEHAYLVNSDKDRVGIFSGANTGKLSLLGSASLPMGCGATMVGLHPAGGIAYVPCPNNGTIQPFAVASDGTLGGGYQPITVYAPESIAFDPSGRYAYVGSGGSSVYVFRVDPATAGLSSIAGDAHISCDGVTSLAVDPNGRFAVAGWCNAVYSFPIDASTGALGPTSTFNTGSSPRVVVDPSGQFVYAASDYLSAFRADSTGTLTPAGVVSTRGAGGAIALAAGAPLRFTPKYAYTVNGDATVSALAIDADSGALTAIGDPLHAGNPQAIAVDPSGKWVVVIDGGVVQLFLIQPDGSLAPQGSAPKVGGAPNSLAFEPSGRFLYAATDQGIAKWPFAGGFQKVGNSTTQSDVYSSIAVDPSGRFLYSVDAMGGRFQWAISQIDGSVAAAGSLASMPATTTAVDPTGRFAYFVVPGEIDVSPVPAAPGKTPALKESATALAFDPLGRYAYVLLATGEVESYAIDDDSGQLTQRLARTGPLGSGASAFAVDPSGRFVYVLGKTNGQNVRLIAQADGTLVAPAVIALHGKTLAMAIAGGIE